MNVNEFKIKMAKAKEKHTPRLKVELLDNVYIELKEAANDITLIEPIVITTIRDKTRGSYYSWLLLPEVIQDYIRVDLVNNGFFVLFNHEKINIYWNKDKFEEDQNQ